MRIYDSNKENYINIYINKQEIKYDKNNILSRINERQFFKAAIFIKYKIKEFLLKNYYLEEEVNNDGLAEKVYILKKIYNNKIMNNQNEIQIEKKEEHFINKDKKSNFNNPINFNSIQAKNNNNLDSLFETKANLSSFFQQNSEKNSNTHIEQKKGNTFNNNNDIVSKKNNNINQMNSMNNNNINQMNSMNNNNNMNQINYKNIKNN